MIFRAAAATLDHQLGVRATSREGWIKRVGRLTSLENGTQEEYHHLEAVDGALNVESIPRDVLALFAARGRKGERRMASLSIVM